MPDVTFARLRALGVRPFLAYSALLFFAEGQDRVTIGLPNLARATEIPEASLRRDLQALVDAGFIRVVVPGGGRGLPTIYELVHSVTQKVSDEPPQLPGLAANVRTAKGVTKGATAAPLPSHPKDARGRAINTQVISSLTPPDLYTKDQEELEALPCSYNSEPHVGTRSTEDPTQGSGAGQGRDVRAVVARLRRATEVRELAYVHDLKAALVEHELTTLVKNWETTSFPRPENQGKAAAAWLRSGLNSGKIARLIQSDPEKFAERIPL